MKIYHYNNATGEYTGEFEARKSPLDDEYLVPAYATIQNPPAVGDKEIAVFIEGGWEIKPDHRGKVYYDTDTQARYQITEIGVEPDPNWTDKKPLENSFWNGTDWEVDFDLWLDNVVRPERNQRMDEIDRLINRYHREVRLGLSITIPLETLDDKNKQLADLPQTLTAVVDPILWPSLTEPAP